MEDHQNKLADFKRRATSILTRKTQAETRRTAAEEHLASVVKEATDAGIKDVKKLPAMIAAAEKEEASALAEYEADLVKAEQAIAKYESQ